MTTKWCTAADEVVHPLIITKASIFESCVLCMDKFLAGSISRSGAYQWDFKLVGLKPFTEWRKTQYLTTFFISQLNCKRGIGFEPSVGKILSRNRFSQKISILFESKLVRLLCNLNYHFFPTIFTLLEPWHLWNVDINWF